MSLAKIRIGTSGYSFEDWKGVFYPEDIPKGKMLDFYAKEFKTVEINSTYYRIPNQAVFYHLNRKTPPDFEFISKVHQEVTHNRENAEESMKALHAVLEPIKSAQKLHGFLAQFPWGFKYSLQNLDYLGKVKALSEETPLFVEFRNRTWIRNEVYQFLRDHEIGYCNVDEPNFPSLVPPQDIATTEIGYMRFHGRNTQNWWGSSGGDRYDYRYSMEELSEWLGRIRSLSQKTRKTYLFFNNCHMGHAVVNARQMMELLFRRGMPAIDGGAEKGEDEILDSD